MLKSTNNRLSISYKEDISKILQCDVSDVFLYRKGRFGLSVILQAIGLEPGDEVILAAYTCRAVIDTIIACGAKPVYADIRKDSYTMDLGHAKTLLTPETKAVISQNTFGLSYDIEEINLWAKSNHIFHIDDCAHGFGGTCHNIPNGRICDAAFYSTHVSKPFNTGIGGFIVVNNDDLLRRIQCVDRFIKRAPFSDCVLLPVSYYWMNKPILRICSIAVRRIRRLFKRAMISHKETSCRKQHITFASTTQIRYGIKNIRHLQDINARRRECACYYTSFFKDHSKTVVPDSFTDDHLFLYYPVLAGDKQKVLSLAKEHGIEVNGLFRIKPDHMELGIDYSTLPATVFISRHLVNLPTDRAIDEKMKVFLDQIVDDIL